MPFLTPFLFSYGIFFLQLGHSESSSPVQTIMNPPTWQRLPKASAAWKYFDVNKDEFNFTKCKLCKAKLAKSSSFNTSNLWKFCGAKVLVVSYSVLVSTRNWCEKKWYKWYRISLALWHHACTFLYTTISLLVGMTLKIMYRSFYR